MEPLLLTRKIAVAPGITVSSEWAVPAPTGAAGAGKSLILAHGAGSDMTHPFLSFIHHGLADAGILSVKFNFPYKESGSKAPDRPALLHQTWQAVIEAVRGDAALAPRQLFIGGKSMGGRIASLLAAQGTACDGLVFLGYPLHPAGQPHNLRTEHWPALRCPALFVAGTADPLCGLELLRRELARLRSPATVHEIPAGDHSFKVPGSLGRTQDAVWAEILRVIRKWLQAPGERATTASAASPIARDRAPDSTG